MNTQYDRDTMDLIAKSLIKQYEMTKEVTLIDDRLVALTARMDELRKIRERIEKLSKVTA